MLGHVTAQKMKFSITDFFSKCDQIRMKLQIWSYLLKKSLMENFIFMQYVHYLMIVTQTFCSKATSKKLWQLSQLLQYSHESTFVGSLWRATFLKKDSNTGVFLRIL